MIRRAMLNKRTQAGQAIYQTMLAISCVMLALAVTFPTLEYFWLYRGSPKPDMFREGAVSTPAPRSPAPAEPSEAPAPADATTPDAGGDATGN